MPRLSNHVPVTPQALEARLIDFGAEVCRAARRMTRDSVGSQISRQLVRSATSPAANYAEACAAESRRDFIHKIRICLKELRETWVWLRFSERLDGESDAVTGLVEECDELVRIFVASVKTAKTAGSRR